MKEEERDCVSIVSESIVRGINVVRKKYSTYTVKRKNIKN